MWRAGPIRRTERGGFLRQVVLIPHLCQSQALYKGYLGIQCGPPDPKRGEHNIPTTTLIYSKSRTDHHSSKAIHSELHGSTSSVAAASGQALDFCGHEQARSPRSSGMSVIRYGPHRGHASPLRRQETSHVHWRRGTY